LRGHCDLTKRFVDKTYLGAVSQSAVFKTSFRYLPKIDCERRFKMAKIPAYRLHKASGQGLVTIRGKDYYLGAHNTKDSKSKYKRLIGEYLAQRQPLTFGQPANDLTIAELMADYLRLAKGYFGEGENSAFYRIARIA